MALPEGWILRVSRSKGKVFYVNTRTQETQWTRPTHAATAPEDGGERVAKKRKREPENEAPSADGVEPKTEEPRKNARAADSDCRAAIARCMRVGASAGGKAFAPWDHQVDAVDKLLEALLQPNEPRANRFLLQHSTGSGKTVTIAALAHQLLYARDVSKRRFHTVVLLIDRVKLDEQVGDSVERFLRRNGIDAIHRATSIDHLAELLAPPLQCQAPSSSPSQQQRVIISTIQKIGLLAKNKVLLTRLLHGHATVSSDGDGDVFSRIAIITDEAHRSHTAATRHTIEAVMNASDESDENPVAFVGFTATPNVEALRLFGSRDRDACLKPFHCYTMASAVADARIVDVLQDYTCIRCELELSIPPDVLVETKAMRAVMDAASDTIDVLKAKSAYMMQDFERARAAWSRAKCMIVTRSRRDVVRYYELITTFVANKRSSWRVFAVFSGAITTEGTEPSRNVTEQSLNPKYSTLASSDIVIVCDKLDTGYSDPLLACMYIDRYLRSSVQTVQLLSRLNRVHPDKSSVRIVDFANHAAQIRRHFVTFWQQATASCDGDGDAEVTPVADWRTALAIIDSSIGTLEKPREHVETLVRTLDRDAFQQVLDAVRLGVAAWTKMEGRDFEDPDEAKWTLRHRQLRLLKSELESVISSTEVADLHVDDVASKTKARVKRYETVFTGHVNPEELYV